MEDFNSYSKKQENFNQGNKSSYRNYGSENWQSDSNERQNLFNLVSSLAKQYDGKSNKELFRAIYEEAKRGKQRGTLKNSDIDNFVNMLWPFLDDKMKKALNKVVAEIKKI